MPIMLPKWDKWDDDVIQEVHGGVRYYRDLFYGNHGKLFERAKALIENGEVIDNIANGRTKAIKDNVRTPYIVANACKIICKVPATLVSRSVGRLGMQQDQEFTEDVELEEGEEAEITYLSDLLESIETASGFLRGTHYSNILQHQIDGGIVAMPVMDDNGIRIDFKKREVYYPHEDNLGCDLVFKRSLETEEGEMEDFIHIHRERIERGDLTVTEMLKRLKDNGDTEDVPEEEAKLLLEVDELEHVYKGRNRTLVGYWANEATFDYPLGMSALYGQENKQDEINWTLTRNSIVFERNGKPRIAVSKEVMSALQQKAFERYNDENLIDHRDLEIVTIDEHGKSLEVVQIDVSKIGDIKWVKDMMKMMFIETETSEKAVDFYMSESAMAQSGVAKFYDLFTSIVKAERLMGEYVDFIQEMVENCYWLMKDGGEYPDLEIVRPTIHIKDMFPTPMKERVETESQATESGIRSKEKAVKNINEYDSDTAIEEELERIEGDQASVNSNTGSQLGLNRLSSMLDNRTPQAPQTGEEGAEE